MTYVDVLDTWGCLAAISVVVDGVAMYRSLTGRDGVDALAMAWAAAARSGGARRWVVTSLALDIFMPWLMWQGFLAGLHDDRVD